MEMSFSLNSYLEELYPKYPQLIYFTKISPLALCWVPTMCTILLYKKSPLIDSPSFNNARKVNYVRLRVVLQSTMI